MHSLDICIYCETVFLRRLQLDSAIASSLIKESSLCHQSGSAGVSHGRFLDSCDLREQVNKVGRTVGCGTTSYDIVTSEASGDARLRVFFC
jgi:hypothetical protein